MPVQFDRCSYAYRKDMLLNNEPGLNEWIAAESTINSCNTLTELEIVIIFVSDCYYFITISEVAKFLLQICCVLWFYKRSY